ncbi:MAG: tail fiber domain-containing protein [Hyphomicrobiaceae bacterium]|nr:tail fiber domain-containing protein [Hyphomicrobiaceae bacterium]
MSFGLGGSKQKSTQKSQKDPWDVAIPGLTALTGKVTDLVNGGGSGVTANQTAAFEQLKQNAAAGNPNAGQIGQLADDMLNTQSQSGTVTNGYADLQRRLNPTADGANLDIMNNPQLAAMLQQVGDDAASRVNASFAAGGRTGSGANQTSVSRGVTQAQLPLLLSQYNQEQGRTDAAARSLFDASGTTAGAVQGLDAAAQDQRAKGIEVGQAALDAQNYGPNAILNLEQQQKEMPVDYLSKLAAILGSIGQLGGQEKGSGTQKGSNWGISATYGGK